MLAQEFSGRLLLSKSGYLLLTVPNAIAIGAFQAMREPGVELPKHQNRPFNAHITVMRPDEVQAVGADKISERGQEFTYRLQGADTVEAKRNGDVYGRYWYLKVVSPALSALRRAYGLEEPGVPFHITYAARRKNVLRTNTVMKQAMRSLRLREKLKRGNRHGKKRR